MLALAKRGNIRRMAELETPNISIPVILPESSALSSDYIMQCINDGIFTTSYPAAKIMFRAQNILQIHRDLNEHCSTLYRRRMAEKLGRPDSAEVEFYVPSPEKYDVALLHFIGLTVEEEMYALSITDANRKFGKGSFMHIIWKPEELFGEKKELAKAMGISKPSAEFFIPFPYVYGGLR